MADLFDYQPPRRYPEAPGFKEQDTSRKAAESMRDSAPLLRQKVLDLVRAHPDGLTPDEAADRLCLSVLSVRPRFTELKAKGRIRDTGVRRKNSSGRSAKVWGVA